jgi:hypothetical protein
VIALAWPVCCVCHLLFPSGFAISGCYNSGAGKKEGWSLFIRLLLKLFEIAACTMQVWVDDGDDEWHCVQTLTEANNW